VWLATVLTIIVIISIQTEHQHKLLREEVDEKNHFSDLDVAKDKKI
jgi:heme exporter protein D